MKGISAYILDSMARKVLASKFPPKFAKFIGHHVTHQFGASDKDPLPPGSQFQVVGYATAEDGLEALVIAIDGNVKRPDGSTYHITWSIDPSQYKPKDSNAVIKENGYTEVDPIEIKMEPVFLPFGK